MSFIRGGNVDDLKIIPAAKNDAKVAGKNQNKIFFLLLAVKFITHKMLISEWRGEEHVCMVD